MPSCTRYLGLTIVGISAATAGCQNEPYSEPTVDAFNGQLTQNGNGINFPADERVVLQLVLHKNGERFGVPITPEGTFKIGWMPIGTYSATLERYGGGGRSKRAPPRTHQVPDGLTIEEGQTEYVVELGEKFKLTDDGEKQEHEP